MNRPASGLFRPPPSLWESLRWLENTGPRPSLARQINIELTPGEQLRFANARPVNPAAHDAYLKGRYYMSSFTEERINKAIEQFNLAIKEDPNFASRSLARSLAAH